MFDIFWPMQKTSMWLKKIYIRNPNLTPRAKQYWRSLHHACVRVFRKSRRCYGARLKKNGTRCFEGGLSNDLRVVTFGQLQN